MKQLNLPDQTSPLCQLVAFPLARRVGKVRNVATKLAAARNAENYRYQVTSALLNHLDRLGISEREQDEQLGAFWTAVEAETMRRSLSSPKSGGDAA